MAVQGCSDFAADGDDFVSVPVVGFYELIPRPVGKNRAAILFIELAPPTETGVGLRAFHFILAETFAVELDAAVRRVRNEFHFKDEPEIDELRFASEEFVVLEAGCGAADDFSILDRPKGHIPFPIREIGAVEEPTYPCGLSRGERGTGNGCGHGSLGGTAQIIEKD